MNGRVLPGNVQVKSVKAGAKNLNSKSKERKNRAVQQPYIVSTKVPQAYLQGQLTNMNPKVAIKAIESLTAASDLRKAAQLA
jgi:hypothetical protein